MTIVRKVTGSKANRNPQMEDYEIVSRRQVELAIEIRAYRCSHQLSQAQFAMIASAYGAPYKIKFCQTEIAKYEKYRRIPSEKKMNALLSMMNIDLETLSA